MDNEFQCFECRSTKPKSELNTQTKNMTGGISVRTFEVVVELCNDCYEGAA